MLALTPKLWNGIKIRSVLGGVVMRWGAIFALALSSAGCVTTETVRFQPKPTQEAITRNGMAAITSRQRLSIVTVTPAIRELPAGKRPVFIVQIQNTSRAPLQFHVDQVQAVQVADGSVVKDLRVFTYEDLTAEERTAQVGRAVLVGLSGALNAAATPNNYWAQANARAENERLAVTAVAQGQANMAALEAAVIKDHTLLPGEAHAGQLHIESPEAYQGRKEYVVTVLVGADRHDIQVFQAPTRSGS